MRQAWLTTVVVGLEPVPPVPAQGGSAFGAHVLTEGRWANCSLQVNKGIPWGLRH